MSDGRSGGMSLPRASVPEVAAFHAAGYERMIIVLAPLVNRRL
jgi:hypothetical protein